MNKAPENLVIYEVEGVSPLFTGPDRPPGLGPHFLGHWIESGYTFFFFSDEAASWMESLLARQSNLSLRHIHRMPYAAWQDGADFRPFQVGSLTIAPAWERLPENHDDSSTIRIDPGLAFGFGGHPTTLACLNMLVRIYREDRPSMVLDLGAGTGILSLAALRMGGHRALAVEYSHVGAEAAKRNVALNGFEHAIEVVLGLAEDHCLVQTDLLCANLPWDVQQGILAGGGYENRPWILVSGLFHNEGETMRNELLDRRYRLIDLVRDERWCTMLFRLGANQGE